MWHELRRTGSRRGSGQQPQAREIKGPLPGQADGRGTRGRLYRPAVWTPESTHTLVHQACVHSSGTATGGGLEGGDCSRSQHIHARGPRAHPPPPLSPEVMAHVQLPAPIPDHSSAPGFSRFQGGECLSQRLGPHPPALVPTRVWANVGRDRICSCRECGPPAAQGGSMAPSDLCFEYRTPHLCSSRVTQGLWAPERAHLFPRPCVSSGW